MVELIKTKKKYLGNIILPINTKLKVENNKIVFKCSSYLESRLSIKSIDNRIDSLILGHNNSKKIVEHESTEEDYEVWNIYAMEEKHIPIRNFSDGLSELLKEFPPSEDETF